MKEINQARQGDVFIEKYENVDMDKLEIVSKEEEKSILAWGEVTGHHHHIKAGNSFLARDKESGKLFVIVTKPTALYHEEHSKIDLKPAAYRYDQQVEWDAIEELVRAVAD